MLQSFGPVGLDVELLVQQLGHEYEPGGECQLELLLQQDRSLHVDDLPLRVGVVAHLHEQVRGGGVDLLVLGTDEQAAQGQQLKILYADHDPAQVRSFVVGQHLVEH